MPRSLTLLVLSILSLPLPAAAQERIRGRVLGEETRRPVAEARVVLLDARLGSIRETLTDSQGRWSLTLDPAAVQEGWHLAVDAEGFASWLSEPLRRPTGPVVTTLQRLASASTEPARIIGQVYDVETGEAIELAQVAVDGGPGDVTGRSGTFVFEDVAGDLALLSVTHAAYVQRQVVVPLHPDQTTQVRIGLAELVYELDPIEVTVRPTLRSRQLEGFERRAEFGFGDFFDREELERLPAVRLGEVLRYARGVRMARDPSARSPLDRGYWNIKVRGRTCTPYVWVNGVLRRGNFAPMELFTLSASDLEAVEVYRGSEVPAEFYDPADSPGSCVTLVVWTR